MFFGYENEAKMRESNPVIAERLIQLATKTTMNVCSPGKRCVAGLPEGPAAEAERQCVGFENGQKIYAPVTGHDRIKYTYDDGSEDYGREITKFRTEFKGHVFAWASE